jgi:hypothetical protein
MSKDIPHGGPVQRGRITFLEDALHEAKQISTEMETSGIEFADFVE